MHTTKRPSMAGLRSDHAAKAFTLIELLVVISIIALLISITLPSLGKARESAKMTQMLSAAKSFGIAQQIYMLGNNGYAMVDRVPGGIPTQDIDGTVIPNQSSQEAMRWPLKLGTYSGSEFYKGAIYCDYNSASLLDSSPSGAGAYSRSMLSTFGLNVNNVGGFSGNLSSNKVIHRPETDAVSPSQLIHFAKSRQYIPSGAPYYGDSRTSGYFYVLDPKDPWTIWPSAQAFDPTSVSASGYGFYWGGIDFKYSSRSIVGYCDGRAAVQNPSDLYDMRYWSDQARRLNDPDHTPVN